jgi:hypothetical protein
MKILIRQKGCELFLNRNNEWVDNLERALTFATGVAAINHATDFGMVNVELFYWFEEDGDIFAFPLSAFGR